MAASSRLRKSGVSLAFSSAPPARCGSSRSISASRSASAALADVVAVQAFQLGEVEAGRRAADLRQVERGDHFLGGENFLIAMAPAEPHQVVAHGRGQIAHGAIGIDAERAMALGEFRAVGPVNQRDMRHHRHLPAERLVDLRLPRAVIEMIVAADDMGDAHVVVVDHHGQHVSGRAVRAQQHEVVEIFVLPGHAALHLIVDDGFAGLRRLQPDHRLHAGRRIGRVAVAPAPVIKLGPALARGPPRAFPSVLPARHSSDRPCPPRAVARPPRDAGRERENW